MLEDMPLEGFRNLFIVLGILGFAVVILFATADYVTAWKQAQKMQQLRESVALSLQKWSENTTGVVNLSLVSADSLPPGMTVRVYYENGTLAKEVSAK